MYQHYIGGELVAGLGPVSKVLNPASGAVVDTFHGASAEQATQALEAAQAAFPAWSRLPVDERIGWIDKLCDAVTEEKERLAELLSAESGKPYAAALGGVNSLTGCMKYYAAAVKHVEGVSFPTTGKRLGEIYHVLERRPLGVVVAHIAWNYPIAMAGLKLGPAMASGCTIVLKPSSETPLATLRLGEILHKIGLPAGAVNILSGPSSTLGPVLNGSTIPRMITLIGSSETGRKVMEEGATSVKRYSLELGGNAPGIIMRDADLGVAVAHTVGMKTSNTGQICTSYNRIYVHADVYEEYCERVSKELEKIKLGSGHDEGRIMGPMINRTSRDRMLGLIAEAVKDGAELVCGGETPVNLEAGNFITPALLKNVREEMRVCKEEIFGPILAVQSFTDLDDVLQKANNTDYGLAAYFFGHDSREISKAFEVLQAGDILVNGASGGMNTPHIGIKQSGLGCDQSIWSLEEYYDMKRMSMIP